MRPLRLEMEGFGTFRSSTVLEFDGLDLVAFTGPTGSGKSTVIDAITFALYGSVARYDNPNLVAPIIHQLANEAKVRLDFEVGGVAHTAVRVVRRTKAGASTREARLERIERPAGRAATADGGGGDDAAVITTLAGSVGELDQAVAELLGLDFNQFTRTIVLPQGDFAQFLRDEPANRQKLLRRLLDLEIYNRIGILAREQAKSAAQQLEAVRPERDRYAPADPTVDEVAEAGARCEHLARVRTEIAEHLDRLSEVERALGPLRESVSTIDARRDQLAAVALPPEAEKLGAGLEAAERARNDAARTLDAARAARDAAAQALEGRRDRAALTSALAALNQRSALHADLDRAGTEAEAATEQVRGLTADAEATEQERAAADAALTAARSMADAAHWTATLEIGADCPVCRRPVESLPDHDVDTELAQARDRADKAAQAARAAETARSRAEADARSATASVERLTNQLGRLDAEMAALFDGPTPSPAELETEIEQIRAAEAERDRSAQAVAAAERTLTEAERTLAQAGERSSALAGDLARLRDGLAALDPPALSSPSLVENWRALIAWSSEADAALVAERAELAAEGKRRAEEKQQIDGVIRARAAEVGIDQPSDRVAEALIVAQSDAVAAQRLAEERRESFERLSARVDELEEARQVDHALGLHLRAERFEGWLLDEALATIVDRATGWLLDLSRGQYSLAVTERQFTIIDHTNADDRRDVRTLSGGETFLASLALALALADSVAELAPVDAPRLESMFLDEGFGTLDPETLDVVAAAIEELAATGRMIGIVTHVPDLAERMPARFEVRKQAGGSTVELVGR